MDNETRPGGAPVVEDPAQTDALALLESSAPAPVANQGQAIVQTADAAPKRKGGWPKGKPRGKKTVETTPVLPNRFDVYDATTANAGGAAIVKDGPLPGVPAAPDPQLVEYVKKPAALVVAAATRLLAFLLKRPGMVATAEERDMLAEAVAYETAAKLPAIAQQAGATAIGLALLNYCLPRMEMLMSGADGGVPVAEVPAPAAPADVKPVDVAPAAPVIGDGTVPTSLS